MPAVVEADRNKHKNLNAISGIKRSKAIEFVVISFQVFLYQFIQFEEL